MPLAVVAATLLVGCGGDDSSSPADAKREARRVAERYLAATRVGDAETACRLLSPSGYHDAGFKSKRACLRDYAQPLPIPGEKIIRVRREGRQIEVDIKDPSSDSGGMSDVILRRYGKRWLIDVG